MVYPMTEPRTLSEISALPGTALLSLIGFDKAMVIDNGNMVNRSL